MQRRRLDNDQWVVPDVSQMSLLDILQEGDRATRPVETVVDRLAALELDYEAIDEAQPSPDPPSKTKKSKTPAEALNGRMVDVPFHAPSRAQRVPDLIPTLDEMLGDFLNPQEWYDALLFILQSPHNRCCLSEPEWRTKQRRALQVFEERAKCFVQTRGRADEWKRLLGELTLRRVVHECDDEHALHPSPKLTCAFAGTYNAWIYQLDDGLYVYCVLQAVSLDYVYLGHMYAQSIESHALDISSSSCSSSLSSSPMSSSSGRTTALPSPTAM